MLLPSELPPTIIVAVGGFGLILGATAAGLRGVTVYETGNGVTLPRWFPHEKGGTALLAHMVFGSMLGLAMTIVYIIIGAAAARAFFTTAPAIAYILAAILGAALTTLFLEAFKLSEDARDVIQLHIAIHSTLFIGSIVFFILLGVL